VVLTSLRNVSVGELCITGDIPLLFAVICLYCLKVQLGCNICIAAADGRKDFCVF